MDDPIRIARKTDFAILFPHRENEFIEEGRDTPEELLKFRKSLDVEVASSELPFTRATTVTGVGANWGAEVVTVPLNTMGAVNTAVTFYRILEGWLKFGEKRERKVLLSEPALQAYILGQLQARFPAEFPPARGCAIGDVKLTALFEDGGETHAMDSRFFYSFEANGSGVRAAGKISSNGRITSNIALVRIREEFEIVRAEPGETLPSEE